MRFPRLVLGPLVALLLATPLAAQRSPDAERNTARSRAALAPLSWLVGTWDGDARVVIGRDQQMLVKQHEQVEWHSLGTVMLIRGTGRSTEAANAGEVVFEATAMIWFDPAADKLRMRTHVDGGSTEPELEIKPDTVIWSFPVPGARIRYTIAHVNGTWHEVGHYIREGAPPVKTIDMRLTRTTK